MVRPNSILGGKDKSHVAMVVWLINAVNQRGRYIVLALRIGPVASSAHCVIGAVPHLLLLRQQGGKRYRNHCTIRK